jgi:hypothetical protein
LLICSFEGTALREIVREGFCSFGSGACLVGEDGMGDSFLPDYKRSKESGSRRKRGQGGKASGSLKYFSLTPLSALPNIVAVSGCWVKKRLFQSMATPRWRRG